MTDIEVRKFVLEMAIKADPTDAVALAEKYYAFLNPRRQDVTITTNGPETMRFQTSQNWAKP